MFSIALIEFKVGSVATYSSRDLQSFVHSSKSCYISRKFVVRSTCPSKCLLEANPVSTGQLLYGAALSYVSDRLVCTKPTVCGTARSVQEASAPTAECVYGPKWNTRVYKAVKNKQRQAQLTETRKHTFNSSSQRIVAEMGGKNKEEL